MDNGSPIERPRGAGLITALSEIAARVQRVRTVEKVLELAGSGLSQLPFQANLTRVFGEQLRIEFVGLDEASSGRIEALISHPVVGYKSPLRHARLLNQALAQGAPVYSDEAGAGVADFFLSPRHPGHPEIADTLRRAGYVRGVFAPVYVNGRSWGVLGICSRELEPEDAAAVSLFAAQLSTALEVAQSIELLERKNRALSAIHQVVTAGNNSDFERLLPHLVTILAHSTDSDKAMIYLLDSAERELVLAGTLSVSEPLAERYRRIPLAGSIEDRVLRSLKPQAFRVEEFPADARSELKAQGVVELAIVPMQQKSRPTGTLQLVRSTRRPFGEEEMSLATLLGEQIAIQIENARLFQEAQRRVSHLSVLFNVARMGTEAREVAPFLDSVLTEVISSLSVTSATVYLLEEDQLVLACHRNVGGSEDFDTFKVPQKLPLNDDTLSARAVQKRVTITSAEADYTSTLRRRYGVLHAAVIPLMDKERVLGTFALARRADIPFGEDEIRLFESCAALLGVAVDRARLFESERKRARDLAVINELGGQIAERLDLANVLKNGVEHLARLCDVPNALLFLVDFQTEIMSLVASTLPKDQLPDALKLSEPSSASHAIKNLQPVVIVDPLNDPRAHHTFTRRLGHKSVLSVPLIGTSGPIGAVILGETRRDRTFHPLEVERAVAICNQLATAISSARLYDDLKKSYTKLSHAQEELVKRERLAAVGELAALVAHEVRNPLAVIFNSLHSLRKSLQPQGEVQTLLNIVNEEANRLNSMVGDFLDFARPNEPNPQLGSLGELVEGALEAATSAAPPTGINIQVEIPEALPKLPFDSRLLRQAIINLAVNGIQAMPKGGVLTLKAKEELYNERRWAVLEVSDSGPGIPLSVQKSLFQPFFTTKATGTGLGLAVVKRIVEAHRGEISFESKPGQATIFRVRLPLEETAVATSAQPS